MDRNSARIRDPERDAQANERARAEMFRKDGQRSLGENIEQADRVIRAAFEMARATGNLDRVR